MAYKNKSKEKKYSGAPYNFVPLCREVYSRYKKQSELPAHNEINDSLLSGEIEYTFQNETDIFVSNGKEGEELDFYKNMKGQYAVPGSTMRGLIRSNMTILGFCSAGEDIADDRFMYRNFESNKIIADIYKSILGLKSSSKNVKFKNVHAGYICKEEKNYCIYRTKEIKGRTNSDSNFYTVNEIYVKNHKENFGYIYNEEKGDENFAPNFLEVSYLVSGLDIKGIADPDKVNTDNADKVDNTDNTDNTDSIDNADNADKADNKFKKGYVVFSGQIKDKKQSFYVIPEPDMENKIDKIDPELITIFKNDVDTKRNQLGDYVEYFSLPEEDGVLKPVFYLGDTEIENFGFTPLMRIFYKKSIKDGINQDISNEGIDYKSAIFGFANDRKAYKSRVYFEDAATDCIETGSLQKRMLMGPKPSSYMDYLKYDPEKNVSCTYMDDEFSIRGIKQYWLTNSTVEDKSKNKESDIASALKPIEAGASFKGKIKFKNLHEDELGLLLWCIRLEDNCCHNIGMGKPFGFGKIKVKDIRLRLYDYKKMYGTDTVSFDVLEKEYRSTDDYIQKYKDHIEAFLGGKLKKRRLEKNSSIVAFLRMKSEIPNINVIRYMDIDRKEYQSRTIPLPDIDYVLRAKDYKSYIKGLTEEASSQKIWGNTVYTADITPKSKMDKNSEDAIIIKDNGEAVGKSLSVLNDLMKLKSNDQ